MQRGKRKILRAHDGMPAASALYALACRRMGYGVAFERDSQPGSALAEIGQAVKIGLGQLWRHRQDKEAVGVRAASAWIPFFPGGRPLNLKIGLASGRQWY